MACGNMASRCARHKQRKGGCSGPVEGGHSCAPWAFPPNRLPGVSVHWPGLMGLGRIRGGLACQNCHCGQGCRARARQEAVLLPSPPPQKAWGPPAQLRLPKPWLVRGPPGRWSWEWATKVGFGGPPGHNWAGAWGTVTDTGVWALARSHLCVPSWGQDTVAMLTFQAEGVPVLAQRTHFLRCGEQGGTGLRGARPSCAARTLLFPLSPAHPARVSRAPQVEGESGTTPWPAPRVLREPSGSH